MMKKTLLVGALSLLASGAAMANGFYAGVGAGGISFNDKTTVSGTSSTGEYIDVHGSGDTSVGSIGLNTQLFAGYAWTFPNKLFVGLEAFGNYTTAKVTTNSDGGASLGDALSLNGEMTTQAKLNYVYGARVLPGFQVTPETVAYAILGYARANVRVTSDTTINSAQLGSTTSSTSDYYNFNGYQIGLGSMTEVTKNVSIRGDVIYTGYQSKTQEGSVTSSAGTASGSAKMELSTLEGDVSLVYKFG